MTLENHIKSHLDACKIDKYVADSYLNKKNEDFDSTSSLTQNDLIGEVKRTHSCLDTFIDYSTKSYHKSVSYHRRYYVSGVTSHH